MGSTADPRDVVERTVALGTAELIPDRWRASAWVVAVNGVLQSYVDLADPTYLRMPFTNWIAQVVDRRWAQGSPISAVHVGGGGFTLPRYVAATRPGSQQTVYELDGQLVALVREHLRLDDVEGLRVHAGDGAAAVREMAPGRTDLVVLDVFRDGHPAPNLATVEFLQQVATALRPGGLYATNIWDGLDLGFMLRAVAAVTEVFQHVLIFAEAGVLMRKHAGNVVITASMIDLPTDALTDWAASTRNEVFCVTPTQVFATCGSAEPLTEAAPLATPVPPVPTWGRGSRFR